MCLKSTYFFCCGIWVLFEINRSFEIFSVFPCWKSEQKNGRHHTGQKISCWPQRRGKLCKSEKKRDMIWDRNGCMALKYTYGFSTIKAHSVCTSCADVWPYGEKQIRLSDVRYVAEYERSFFMKTQNGRRLFFPAITWKMYPQELHLTSAISD